MNTMTRDARNVKPALETIGAARDAAGRYTHPEAPGAIVRVILPTLNVAFKVGGKLFAEWDAAARYSAVVKAKYDAFHGQPVEPAAETPEPDARPARVPNGKPRVVRLRFAARRASLLAERAQRRAGDARSVLGITRRQTAAEPFGLHGRAERLNRLARAAWARERALWAALDEAVAGRLAGQATHAAMAV